MECGVVMIPSRVVVYVRTLLLLVLLLLWNVCLAQFFFYRLLTLAMAVRSLSLIDLVAAVCVSEGRVVVVSYKWEFEVVLSVFTRCFSSSSSSHCNAAICSLLWGR